MSTNSQHFQFSMLTDDHVQERLAFIRKYVAQPISADAMVFEPAWIAGGHLLVGNKYHAASLPQNQVRWKVLAVLNCASGGISRLPVDQMKQQGIDYQFTNVQQDNYSYPILFDPITGAPSKHLKIAKSLYESILLSRAQQRSPMDDSPTRALFFCIAGQNRSATLAIAVLLLFGHQLEDILKSLAQTRPFVLENVGFQRQLVELEGMLQKGPYTDKIPWRLQQHDAVAQSGVMHACTHMYTYGTSSERVRQLESILSPSSIPSTMHPAESSPAESLLKRKSSAELLRDSGMVEVELYIPGLCTLEARIPQFCTIQKVKECLVEYANKDILAYSQSIPLQVAKSWLILAMFGYDNKYDFPLEDEAIERSVQLNRLQHMFGLSVQKSQPKGPAQSHRSSSGVAGRISASAAQLQPAIVEWTSKCRFGLVVFSTFRSVQPNIHVDDSNDGKAQQGARIEEPWTFVHEERPEAPATLLENTLMSTYLRAWDFVTGQSYCSTQPIVFSFATDPRDKRQFMRISTSANEPVQFHAPGEGGILGMGANAIVHRVHLEPILKSTNHLVASDPQFIGNEETDDFMELDSIHTDGEAKPPSWDAAVKRHFGLDKMVASLENRSEAGLAKRLRLANSLNSDGRVVEFYGLGVALAANAYDTKEYKFEATLLGRYEEEFSTYTLRRFMEDYTCRLDLLSATSISEDDRASIQEFQHAYSLISVKVLIVNLLNGFRDLTLMGVQAFDFNHLNNVLISRDNRTVRLIDIDGDSKGSIQVDDEYMQGTSESLAPHKPCLDVDLNAVLPTMVQQLILGKGRGRAFVTNTISEIWKASPEIAKERIRQVLRENFYSDVTGEDDNIKADKHIRKVSEWFYSMLKKTSPWDTWTSDIYDAMRCIDHLPIS